MPQAGLFTRILYFVTRCRVSMIGAIMVSVLLPVLLISAAFDALGLIDNPYFGFLIYVVAAPLFLLGLVLLITGGLLFSNREELGAYTLEYLREQLNRPGRYSRVRRLLYFTVTSTLLLVFVVGVVSYSSFRFTSSPQFCGQFCHTVMEPQYTAYRNSPHSRVSCVECHLGSGSSWKDRTGFTGIRQIYSLVTDSYPRPILSPIDALRPGRATCEQCHLPEKFHGSRLYTRERYRSDEGNTREETVILMKVGSGESQGRRGDGVHWHVAETRQLWYRPGDGQRENIVEVVLREEGRKDVVYSLPEGQGEHGPPQAKQGEEALRLMDCVDCHNRPTHIFRSAEEALDRKMAANIIPSYLPYIKRQALAAVEKPWPSRREARIGISRELQDWYGEHYPDLLRDNPSLFEKAVEGAIQAWEENVFPDMGVTWGMYGSNLGHREGGGCFRCHGRLVDNRTGTVISRECTLCHIVAGPGGESGPQGENLRQLLKWEKGREDVDTGK